MYHRFTVTDSGGQDIGGIFGSEKLWTFIRGCPDHRKERGRIKEILNRIMVAHDVPPCFHEGGHFAFTDGFVDRFHGEFDELSSLLASCGYRLMEAKFDSDDVTVVYEDESQIIFYWKEEGLLSSPDPV